MIAIGMIVGSPLLSFLSNRVFQGRKPVLVLSSFVVLCLTALLAFYTDGIPLLGLYLISLGLGIFASAVVVIGFTTTKELFPVQMAGTSTGLVNLLPSPLQDTKGPSWLFSSVVSLPSWRRSFYKKL
jgi:MFS family permease